MQSLASPICRQSYVVCVKLDMALKGKHQRVTADVIQLGVTKMVRSRNMESFGTSDRRKYMKATIE